MKIKKFRDHYDRIAFAAFDKKDDWFFQHCANGSTSVITKVYNANIENMILMHGVSHIQIIDQTRIK